MKSLISILISALVLCHSSVFAANESQEKVLALRPTQFAVGIMEVLQRVRQLQSLSPSKLDAYLKKRPVPVILGPAGKPYMIDHHHLSRAAWQAGIKKLYIEQKADFSGLSVPEFWDKMRDKNWVYPYDQLGLGPHDPIRLPVDVQGLADDPYRSLSWRIRDDGGYDKTPAPFAEFKWADFFRKNLTIVSVNDNFNEAVREALELSKSPQAAGLPGYKGRWP